MLPFMKKEAGLRVEPRTFNNDSLALRPNHNIYLLAWLNVRIVLKQCLLFPSFFSLFEDLSVLISPSSTGVTFDK